MSSIFRNLPRLILGAALASQVLVSGCAVHARVYDPYYSDYHTWDNHETVFYGQWEHDTHRDHVDFDKRNDADKKAYWDYRHQNDHK